ncbi:hypothetical protein ACFQ78_39600 [Streptomyces sp. NPDC056519]
MLIEVCVNAIAREGLPFPASVLRAITCGLGGHLKDTTENATSAP